MGERLAACLARHGVSAQIRLLNLGNGIVEHGEAGALRAKYGVDAIALAAAAMEMLEAVNEESKA